MKVIFDLNLKYLKRNPKRCILYIVSIVLAVFIFTIISNAFAWSYAYMQGVEEYNYGTWQVRYGGLTESQVKELEKKDAFRTFDAKQQPDGTWTADVELKKVNKKIFPVTQEIGKEIGMETRSDLMQVLPDKTISEYDISYHINLLNFYGLSRDLKMVLSLRSILIGILAVIMGIFALFIYSILSLSFMEKRKYLGYLDCVGASAWQKRMFVFGEGILTGAFSIPVGLAAGVAGSILLIGKMQEMLEDMFGTSSRIPQRIDGRILLIAAVLGILTIILASVMPAIKAGKVSTLELLTNPTDDGRNTEGIKNFGSRKSVELNMAVRNLICSRQKSIKIIVITAFAIVVAFNGMITIRGINSYYQLRDDRKEIQPDAWVEIHSDDLELKGEIEHGLEGLSCVDQVTYVSVLNLGGIIIDKEHLAEDLTTFEICNKAETNPMHYFEEEFSGKKLKNRLYAFDAKVIGLDEDIYEKYAEACGVSMSNADGEEYPVIIEDYMGINIPGEASVYRSVLDIKNDTDLDIMYGKYGDYFLGGSSVMRTEDAAITFRVLNVNQKRPEFPTLINEYSQLSLEPSQYETNHLKFYMPYGLFQKFVKDERIKTTYGDDTPNDSPIINYAYFSRKSGYQESEIRDAVSQIMKQTGLNEYYPGTEERYINDSHSYEYEVVENLLRKKLISGITEAFQRMLAIGGIVIITFFTVLTLLNYILAGIYLRKREFAVLKSIGMSYEKIRKMILYEMGILISIASVIGAVTGSLISISQFREIKRGTGTVAITFPWQFLVMEILVIFFLSFLIVIGSVRKIRRINMIEALKNENE